MRFVSRLCKYLESTGVLETKDEARIAEAKKAYCKQYDKARRQKSRTQERRELSVAFPADDIYFIHATAKAKGHTVQDYIRACVKADMAQLTIIPHRSLVNEIMQAVQQCNNQLEAIKQKDSKSWLLISRTYENAETVLKQTESRISDLLKRPKSLKETIMETISRNPNTMPLLKSILAGYGYQINDPKDKNIPPAP